MATKVYNNGEWKAADNATVDSYSKTESDDRYLKLSGGTMTGDIVAHGGTNGFLKLPSNDNALSIFGGVDILGGASLWLNGLNRDSTNKGCFMLGASTGTTFHWFRGTPDGELTWDNNDVCTRKDATISLASLESGWTVVNSSALQIAPNVYYIMLYLSSSSAITTAYKKLCGNTVTIDGAKPYKGQILSGQAHSDGGVTTLVYNSSGNWWVGVPTETIAANEKIYFSGILRTA